MRCTHEVLRSAVPRRAAALVHILPPLPHAQHFPSLPEVRACQALEVRPAHFQRTPFRLIVSHCVTEDEQKCLAARWWYGSERMFEQRA